MEANIFSFSLRVTTCLAGRCQTKNNLLHKLDCPTHLENTVHVSCFLQKNKKGGREVRGQCNVRRAIRINCTKYTAPFNVVVEVPNNIKGHTFSSIAHSKSR
jgi:hypothetical protein